VIINTVQSVNSCMARLFPGHHWCRYCWYVWCQRGRELQSRLKPHLFYGAFFFSGLLFMEMDSDMI